jgi:hypothetical protein
MSTIIIYTTEDKDKKFHHHFGHITDEEIVKRCEEHQSFINKIIKRFGDTSNPNILKVIEHRRKLIDELLEESNKVEWQRQAPYKFDSKPL